MGGLSTSAFIIVVSFAFLGLAIFLIFMASKSALEDSRLIRQRLEGRPEEDTGGTLFVNAKTLENFAAHLTLPSDEEMTKIRFELSRAGFYGNSVVKSYYALRLICLIVPQFLILGLWGFISAKLGVEGTVLLACVLTFIGFMGPVMFVRWRQNKRLIMVQNGFPDMMDLLVACIEAGLGLNAALMRVAHEIGRRYPPLKINLDLLNLELRAGRARNEAMMNFSNRLNLEEARALAVMMRQSEEMGSSLGTALRTFSEDMRHKRMMRAEEKAMSLGAKLTVPLIVFIFPTIMIMLMLPAGQRLIAGLT